MSCFHLNPEKTTILIPNYETIDGIEFYKIVVKCFNDKEWTCFKRYKDFSEFHELIKKETAIEIDIPGKKIIKSREFIEKRREQLEKYLQTIVRSVQISTPVQFVEFLDFHIYDRIFILQKLAIELSQQGNNRNEFTILEVHAISSRLRLPCPSFELQNPAFDFSNILDHCSQLQSLRIVPAIGNFSTKEEFLHHLISPIGTSNILPSTLPFDLSPFTHLSSLELCGIVTQNIENCDSVKATVVNLKVTNTRVQNIQQILIPANIHGDSISMDQSWNQVRTADFGYNDIWQIDPAMRLLTGVQIVHLNNNRLQKIANLKSLCHLSHLNLSGNLIESLQNWHLELGNVGTLNLSGNKLKSLAGLSRLRSLHSIDLSWNEIEDVTEIDQVALLPIIENLSLNGNLLALEVDYRARILSRFGDRCGDIILDNEKARPSEIDKAMVLAALRMTKINQ